MMGAGEVPAEVYGWSDAGSGEQFTVLSETASTTAWQHDSHDARQRGTQGSRHAVRKVERLGCRGSRKVELRAVRAPQRGDECR